jgi:hypothetical protein
VKENSDLLSWCLHSLAFNCHILVVYLHTILTYLVYALARSHATHLLHTRARIHILIFVFRILYRGEISTRALRRLAT